MGDISVLLATKRPFSRGAVIMSQVNRPIFQTAPSDDVRARRGWYRSGWWLPRPTTILIGLLVGSSLYVMITMNRIIAQPPADPVASPFSDQGARPNPQARRRPPPRSEADTLAPDLVIAAALLASACLTTQVAVCRFIGSSGVSIRSACLWIAAVALFLALWRSGSAVAVLILSAAFGYSLASPIVLLFLILAYRDPWVQRHLLSGRARTWDRRSGQHVAA
jgi:hypothetical protein